MWRGRYSVLTTFSSVATLGLTKPALSAAAQSLTNWSRSPPGTPSLSVSSLYCRQSQDTTTHIASNVNSARSRWPARSTLWTKTTRYQLCLTLSLSPFSLSGLLFGGLLLSLWPQVWQMQEDDLPGGEHGDPHQSQGKLSSGWCQLRETTQLQALDRDFHVECFVCESCGCRLSDDSDSRQDLLAISA